MYKLLNSYRIQSESRYIEFFKNKKERLNQAGSGGKFK